MFTDTLSLDETNTKQPYARHLADPFTLYKCVSCKKTILANAFTSHTGKHHISALNQRQVQEEEEGRLSSREASRPRAIPDRLPTAPPGIRPIPNDAAAADAAHSNSVFGAEEREGEKEAARS